MQKNRLESTRSCLDIDLVAINSLSPQIIQNHAKTWRKRIDWIVFLLSKNHHHKHRQQKALCNFGDRWRYEPRAGNSWSREREGIPSQVKGKGCSESVSFLITTRREAMRVLFCSKPIHFEEVDDGGVLMDELSGGWLDGRGWGWRRESWGWIGNGSTKPSGSGSSDSTNANFGHYNTPFPDTFKA